MPASTAPEAVESVSMSSEAPKKDPTTDPNDPEYDAEYEEDLEYECSGATVNPC